jgi:ankyrin repeat domain-containing protein 50
MSRHAEAAPVLIALLLTRPEVNRKSLIALKGRKIDGTREWLIQHHSYQEGLTDINLPLLWILEKEKRYWQFMLPRYYN